MSPNLVMTGDGKKFLWDGELYASKEEAERVAESYRNENFQIQMVEEDGKFLVYSRRTVKEWVPATQ
jgi:hypothetical protein